MMVTAMQIWLPQGPNKHSMKQPSAEMLPKFCKLAKFHGNTEMSKASSPCNFCGVQNLFGDVKDFLLTIKLRLLMATAHC